MVDNVVPLKREGLVQDDDYDIGLGSRRHKVYLLTESEMETLVWAPWWMRRRLIKRVREETTFEDEE